MTNKEKFLAVFHQEPDTSFSPLRCSKENKLAKCKQCRHGNGCICDGWWNAPYRNKTKRRKGERKYTGDVCGDCIYLNLEEKYIDRYRCTYPGYKWRTGTAFFKLMYTRACKAFVRRNKKEDDND